MAETTKVLRRRVRSVKNIQQITRAMEMVSAAKLRRAQTTLMAGRPYAAKLRELLGNLAQGVDDLNDHPLFVPREGHRKLLVVFTADRGLCGSYNTHIIKRAEDTLKSEPETQWELVCVGRRGADYFSRRQWPVLHRVTGLNGQADLNEARRLTQFLVERYAAEQCDSVWLLYQAFVSTAVCRPTLERYLSMTPEALGLNQPQEDVAPHRRRRVEYILEPSVEEVFDSILPRYLTSRIYITMAEAATSEHSQRMVAMSNATKSCNEMRDQLTLRMNNARQAAITKELLEIVSGADALKTG